MFTLIIEDKHGGIADEYSFEDGEFYIGRSHTSDIILPSDNVSRRHARLYVVDGKCYIEDLNSSNGVFVNGRRINEVFQLQRTAQIKVGDYYLHIENDAVAPVEEEKTWCKLIGRNLSFANQVFKVQRKVTLIGRGKDCTLTIIDPSVSRIHTKLSVERSGTLTLEDLKSSNGTFINNERVEIATVQHRDIVRIGNVEFLVEIPEDQTVMRSKDKPAKAEADRAPSARSSANTSQAPRGAPAPARPAAAAPSAAGATGASPAAGASPVAGTSGASSAAGRPAAPAKPAAPTPTRPAPAASPGRPAAAASRAAPAFMADDKGSEPDRYKVPDTSDSVAPDEFSTPPKRPPPPAATTSALRSLVDDEWMPKKTGLPRAFWIGTGIGVAVILVFLVVAFKDSLFGTAAPEAVVATAPEVKSAEPTAAELAEAAQKKKKDELAEVDAILEAGNDYLKSKAWDQARERFEEVLKRDPLNDRARAALNRVKEWAADKARIEEARKLRDALKRGEAAKILREVTDTSEYYGEAQEEVRALLQAKPTLELTAENQLRQKDCTSALATLREILLIDPKDGAAATRVEEINKLVEAKRCAK